MGHVASSRQKKLKQFAYILLDINPCDARNNVQKNIKRLK